MNTIISRKSSNGTVYLTDRGYWVNEPVLLPEQFGEIYRGNNPTHGVFSETAIREYGVRAIAISHHWSETAALVACNKETETRHENCIVLAFENIQ